jgi:hypothetical protein
MAEFESFAPNAEVHRNVLGAFLEGFPETHRGQGQEVLRNHGLSLENGKDFMNLQSFLNAMREVNDKMGADLLYLIGSKIAHNAVLPPGIDSLDNCLVAIDKAYHMNHRNGEIGYYKYASLGNDGVMMRGTMECRNPYPCVFDRGVLEGFAERFTPKGISEVFIRDDDAGWCRRLGKDSCLYHVSW